MGSGQGWRGWVGAGAGAGPGGAAAASGSRCPLAAAPPPEPLASLPLLHREYTALFSLFAAS